MTQVSREKKTETSIKKQTVTGIPPSLPTKWIKLTQVSPQKTERSIQKKGPPPKQV